MKFNGHVQSPGHFQNAGVGSVLPGHLRIGGIGGDDEVPFFGPGHQFSVKGQVHRSPGGVVGVIDPDEPGLFQDFFTDGPKIRSKTVLFQKRQEVGHSAGEQGAAVVDRVARLRHQRHIARVENGQREMGDALLGPDEGADMPGAFKPDSVAPPIPGRHRVPKDIQAGIGRVLVVGRVRGRPV